MNTQLMATLILHKCKAFAREEHMETFSKIWRLLERKNTLAHWCEHRLPLHSSSAPVTAHDALGFLPTQEPLNTHSRNDRAAAANPKQHRRNGRGIEIDSCWLGFGWGTGKGVALKPLTKRKVKDRKVRHPTKKKKKDTLILVLNLVITCRCSNWPQFQCLWTATITSTSG